MKCWCCCYLFPFDVSLHQKERAKQKKLNEQKKTKWTKSTNEQIQTTNGDLCVKHEVTHLIDRFAYCSYAYELT